MAPLISDDTQTIQLRRTILNSIEEMDIEMLKRIAYECRCEEMGIYPDSTYLNFWRMTKAQMLRVIATTAQAHVITREEKFQVFINVCDNMLTEGRITKQQHSRWTNVF
jgi:hypothetical protein